MGIKRTTSIRQIDREGLAFLDRNKILPTIKKTEILDPLQLQPHEVPLMLYFMADKTFLDGSPIFIFFATLAITHVTNTLT